MHASDLTEEKRLSLNWQDNNAMHAKPDLRLLLKWMIAGSGSVIADVVQLKVP